MGMFYVYFLCFLCVYFMSVFVFACIFLLVSVFRVSLLCLCVSGVCFMFSYSSQWKDNIRKMSDFLS